MFEQFPYSNFHEMNMDWVIKVVEDFKAKYEYIEELIRTGKEDIINLTAEELQALTDKKEELEALLQEWYDTHSEDIARELTAAISTFNTNAANIADQTLASIPADYTALSKNVTDLENVLKLYNTAPLSMDFFTRNNGTHNGITYNWGADGRCTITGTSTATSVNNLYANTTALPAGIEAGKYYYLKYKTSNPNVFLSFAFYRPNSNISYVRYSQDSILPIPADCVGVMIRLFIDSGKTFSTPAVVSMVDILSLEAPYLTDLSAKGFLQDVTDLNDVKNTNGYYLINAGAEIDHMPVSSNTWGGMLLVYNPVRTITVQQFLYLKNNDISCYTRKYLQIPDTWDNWTEVRGSGTLSAKGLLSNVTDLNDVKNTNGFYLINAGAEIDNMPFSPNTWGGLLFVYSPVSTVTVQEFLYLANNNISCWARKYIQGTDTWDNWTNISGSTTNVTNNFNFPEYSNTYNLTATPTITTDTNNYLPASGNTNDRSADIMAMLTATGVCHLGPGNFYVSGIDIPVYGELCGCGNKSSIILIEGNNYAVKMNSYSSVHDVWIKGLANTTQYTPVSNIGSSHGILWQGTASEESSGTSAPYRGRISNVTISAFHGGGIACYNTGLAWSSSVIAENIQIQRCDAGIYIPYFSEFNRFVNMEVGDCYYGCVCNGGNNFFTNCCFSGNRVNLLMDDSNGQSRNNSHGAFVACSFHHSYSDSGVINQGTAVRLLGLDNGEMFSACSFGYGAIEINDCNRMQFTGCQFIPGITINVNGSIATLFTGCTFMHNQAVTITGSTATAFNGCYDSQGAAYNPG